MRHRFGSRPGRRAALFAAAFLVHAPAHAKGVTFPKDDPRVSLEVPDDWTISYTAAGLELRAPGKDSVVVADVVKRDEKAVEAWAKQARVAMIADGVTFAKKPKPARVLTFSQNDTAAATTFSLSGAGLGAPKFGLNVEGGRKTDEPAQAPQGPPKPYKVVQTFGATMGKGPVDIELAFYTLGADRFFLIEQQSGPTDGRGAAIAKSLEILH